MLPSCNAWKTASYASSARAGAGHLAQGGQPLEERHAQGIHQSGTQEEPEEPSRATPGIRFAAFSLPEGEGLDEVEEVPVVGGPRVRPDPPDHDRRGGVPLGDLAEVVPQPLGDRKA